MQDGAIPHYLTVWLRAIVLVLGGNHRARHSLIDEGAPGWDAAARALMDRHRAMSLMVSGMAALVAIVALMVLRPADLGPGNPLTRWALASTMPR